MSRTNKYWLPLSLCIGIFTGISIYTAHAAINAGNFEIGEISEYIPTFSGATEASADLSCDQQGYHKFTFSLYNIDTGGTQTYDGYYAYIEYYKITLHSDFVNNADMDRLSCSTPFLDEDDHTIYIDDCSGSETQTQGGDTMTTTITKTNNYDGTYTIKWAYTGGAHPWIATFNDWDSFEEAILFYGDEDVDTGDTATTDAKIYWHIYGVDLESSDDEEDFSTWDGDDFIYIDDNDSIDFDNSAWYTDGDTAVTTFESCEEDLYCDDLDITAPTAIDVDDAGDTHNIVIDVDDQNGDAWNGTYEYYSEDSAGNDGDCEFRDGTSGTWDTDGSHETTDENIYVRNCNAGDTIYVQEIDYPTACNAELSIDDRCEDLWITTPTEITVEDLEESSVTITISAEALSGDTWDGDYTYTAYSSDGSLADGEFYKSTSWLYIMSRTNPYSTDAETVYYFNGEEGDRIVVTEDDYPTYCSDEITADTEEAPYCGDGTVDAGEECDDGNTVDTDSCSNSCTTPTTPEVCDLDGVLEPENGETCDDGNTVDTDSCSNSCNPNTPPSGVCDLDGILEPENGETCDDGNTVDTDSCSNSCNPNGTSSGVCDLDGIVEVGNGETCDDGNTVDTDSCSNSCNPNGTSSGVCDLDGIVEVGNGETCDDGNTVDTDSCSNSCNPNGGGGPGGGGPDGGGPDGGGPDGGEENPYCGDGNVDSGEECDDGNTDETDGCLSDCTIPAIIITPPSAGEILKNVFTLEHEPLDVAWAEDEHLLYDVIYTAGTYDSVTITDTISGTINSNESSNGTITYDNDLLVINCGTDAENCHNQIKTASLQDAWPNDTTADLEAEFSGKIISECTAFSTEICYTGDPSSSITLNNLTEGAVIAITYHAFMDSAVECDNPAPFAESFTNTATGSDGSADDTTLWALCTYLLTRNAGEVYFGKQPQFGHDISAYSISTANGNITANGFSKTEYSNTDIVNRIASFLTEIVQSFSANFTVQTLADTLSENQIRVSRNVTPLVTMSTTLTSLKISDLEINPATEAQNNIYRFKGDVTISTNTFGDSNDLGARTIIVEEGDLYITGDIELSENTPLPAPQNLPILALIVPNGDIFIKPYVHTIDAVLYTTGGLYGDGLQTPWSPARLTITGAVFGDLEPEALSSSIKAIMDPDARFAMGKPDHDGGAVVIRYDERILLNPPPGLAHYTNAIFTEVSE